MVKRIAISVSRAAPIAPETANIQRGTPSCCNITVIAISYPRNALCKRQSPQAKEAIINRI